MPFAERFFELVRERHASGQAGFVGQITANSFMKREFGKKLIENYFSRDVELTHVLDTSGAYIPGHGTPTVILAGRRRYPKKQTVRAVLGILGEPSAPADPSEGLVWTAITENYERPDLPNPYVTIADLPRSAFAEHPWSLSGGGASETLKSVEDAAQTRIRDRVFRIGFFGLIGEDESMVLPTRLRRCFDDAGSYPAFVVGDVVRDFELCPEAVAFFPYDEQHRLQPLEKYRQASRMLWPTRTTLGNRATFARRTYFAEGRDWWEWHQLPIDEGASPFSIAFAFVATHNHFVLDRGGKVFKQSAPVIKLPEGASEDDHLALLGLLNSSTACFWLKQVSYPKGGDPVGTQGARVSASGWDDRYEFTGTKIQEFPLPEGAPLERARRLDQLAQRLVATRPGAIAAADTPTRDALEKAHGEYDRIRGEMIAVQEELDWEVYRLYGLLDDDLTASEEAVPQLRLGERAFEIVLARKLAAGEATTEWFARHGSTPITEIPEHWPEAYRQVVQHRIQIIEERSDIALIERPECKRRWATTPWETQEKAALRDWLLDRLESEALWREAGRARALSVAQLADRVGVDTDFRGVLTLYCGRDDYDLPAELTRLTADETVPFLAGYRYKPSGLRKRAQWERTWELQRLEDADKPLDGPIPVPPKYGSGDFAKPSYWRNRGKLDVSKERFVLYPKAGRDGDKTPVLGWAGWNHLDQAQALATLYMHRKTDEGWPAERLLPLLAGLVELEPWLHQWYADAAPGYPGSPAGFYTTLIDTELAALGHGRGDLVPEKLP